ncbi:MAG: hypothetical protein ABJE10_05980 [bacterium]
MPFEGPEREHNVTVHEARAIALYWTGQRATVALDIIALTHDLEIDSATLDGYDWARTATLDGNSVGVG